jgi:hypothetical protein
MVAVAVGAFADPSFPAPAAVLMSGACMGQMANPGSVLTTADTLQLAEGYVATKPLGPVPVKRLADLVEIYEVTGAGPARTRLEATAGRGLTLLCRPRHRARAAPARAGARRPWLRSGGGNHRRRGGGEIASGARVSSFAPHGGLAGSGIQYRFLRSRNALPNAITAMPVRTQARNVRSLAA